MHRILAYKGYLIVEVEVGGESITNWENPSSIGATVPAKSVAMSEEAIKILKEAPLGDGVVQPLAATNFNNQPVVVFGSGGDNRFIMSPTDINSSGFTDRTVWDQVTIVTDEIPEDAKELIDSKTAQMSIVN